MRKGRVILALAVIAGSMVWVMAKGLAGNLVYYVTPTDIRDGEVAAGERARLGGYVEPDSVTKDGTRVTFTISDGEGELVVVHNGVLPNLFREGQGVVVEGFLAGDGRFRSDTVLIKHDGEYAPPEEGESPHEADLAD